MNQEKALKQPLISKKTSKAEMLEQTDQGWDYSLVAPAGFEDFEQNTNVPMPVKKEDKKTNFNDEFAKFKKNTEITFPFTMTQFEDVLYVRENTLLTLQYIFYQKDQKTTLLHEVPLFETNSDGTKTPIIGQDGKPLFTEIGLENYQQEVYQDDKG
jgi:hypothetical protein